MDPLKLAKTRYTSKHYDPDKKIPEKKVDELREILRLTPSSINIQPWFFYFVRDYEVKKKLAEASLYNVHRVIEADLLIVLCVVSDLDMFQKVVDQYPDKELRDYYNNLRETMSEADLKAWFKNQVYIALGFGLSASIAMGLDSTPMEGIEHDKYTKILDIKGYEPVLGMAVGYAAKDDYNRLEVKPKERRPIADIEKTI